MPDSENVNTPTHEEVAANNRASDVAPAAVSAFDGPSWALTVGTPSALGATWLDVVQAFNFAVYSEHAESETL